MWRAPYRDVMLLVSLTLNALVLAPVLYVLAANGEAAALVWGSDGPARRILAAIYCAILAVSVVLLVLLALGRDVVAWSQALLAVQVIYKFLTVAFVGLRNPVVVANLAIAVVHSATLVVLS